MMKPGIFASNENHYNIQRMMEIDWGSATILHGAAERIYSTTAPDGSMSDTSRTIIEVLRNGWQEPGWRQAPPHHMPILLRHFHGQGWQNRNPREWAAECAGRANRWRDITLYHQVLNEPNLHSECGWPVSEQPRAQSKEHYRLIRDWFGEFAEEFKRLVPWAKLGSPALASGHSEDQDDNGDGTVGLEILRPVIEQYCDFLCHHDYWFQPEQALSEWYGMRWTRVAKMFSLPIWVDECGWYMQNETNPDAGKVYYSYFSDARWIDRVLGVNIFIWDTDAAHPGQRIVLNPTLVEALDEMCKAMPAPAPALAGVVDYRKELSVWPYKHPTKQYARRALTDIDTWVIHHVGAGDTGLPPTAVARYHVQDLDWPGIGYHYFITGDGTIYWCQDLENISYHCSIHNSHTVGVCLAGDFTTGWPTEAQMKALDMLLPQKDWSILGHRELSGIQTICPGEWIADWGGPGTAPSRNYRELYESLRLSVEDALDELNEVQNGLFKALGD